MTDTKRCWQCKEHKPLDEFHKNVRQKDGLQTSCKVCHKANATAQYAAQSHQTGKVYRLTCLRSGLSYIGSTTLTLTKRLGCHRSAAKAGKQTAVHSHMRTYSDPTFWKIECLRDFGYIDSENLRILEQNAIDQFQPQLNMIAANTEEANRGC